ncbi:helix-turn-helix transcriptional regulator [Catelliglobosispora koreensis]|uniref:helix-turn-helix transcriptional regulator n=1 Tax=Catelliglobosispora koreensis TaxID=129052 RepID=UPI00035C37E6|nr:helix-turn-helix transcriptional regulator [Catelliglobosispora koreensis]
MSDNELGLFLRTRREALTPAEAGLPPGSRRRTTGLRRSEVATLAGVSVEYVTRLEQGRDRHPSPQVLSALAGALRLSGHERIHLHRLTKAPGPGFNCRGESAPAETIRPAVQAILDRLEPTPAVLLNRLNDMVAYTDGFGRLARPAGLLDGERPNFARFVFTDARAREVFPDWDHVADDQVATLKQGPFRIDRHVAGLADELTVTAGEAFTARVASLPGLPKPSGVIRFQHPDVGPLRLAYETLELPADDDQRLLIYVPADAATTAALDDLNWQRAPLRLVS